MPESFAFRHAYRLRKRRRRIEREREIVIVLLIRVKARKGRESELIEIIKNKFLSQILMFELAKEI